MDSQKQKALKDRLHDADPAHQHPELYASRVQALKERILSAASQPTPTKPLLRWPQMAFGLAATTVILFTWFWLQPRNETLVEKPVQMAQHHAGSFQNLTDTRVRELQFKTPSGTRIIWQFKAETPSTQTP